MRICDTETADQNLTHSSPAGRLTFLESISILDRQPRDFGLNDTIVFYNNHERFDYTRPEDFADLRSGIVCSPNNYNYCADGAEAAKVEPTDGTVRLTVLANFDHWAALSPDDYQQQKRQCYEEMLAAAVQWVPDFRPHIVGHDMFTPTTIVRYTGHDHGAVYGAPQKRYDATTHLENLLICGADQGYVGIVGTLTSGIQVANMLLR
jgi:phytoene dehydrogenase-like protein